MFSRPLDHLGGGAFAGHCGWAPPLGRHRRRYCCRGRHLGRCRRGAAVANAFAGAATVALASAVSRNDTGCIVPGPPRRPQISNHSDSAAGIFLAEAAPHTASLPIAPPPTQSPRAALLLTAPPFTAPFLTGRPVSQPRQPSPKRLIQSETASDLHRKDLSVSCQCRVQ